MPPWFRSAKALAQPERAPIAERPLVAVVAGELRPLDLRTGQRVFRRRSRAIAAREPSRRVRRIRNDGVDARVRQTNGARRAPRRGEGPSAPTLSGRAHAGNLNRARPRGPARLSWPSPTVGSTPSEAPAPSRSFSASSMAFVVACWPPASPRGQGGAPATREPGARAERRVRASPPLPCALPGPRRCFVILQRQLTFGRRQRRHRQRRRRPFPGSTPEAATIRAHRPTGPPPRTVGQIMQPASSPRTASVATMHKTPRAATTTFKRTWRKTRPPCVAASRRSRRRAVIAPRLRSRNNFPSQRRKTQRRGACPDCRVDHCRRAVRA